MAVQNRRGRELDYSSGDGGGYSNEVSRPAPNILAIIWRQRWIVVVCAVLALAGAFTYLSKATPIFGSSSIVYVQQSAPKIMGEMMATGQRSNGFIFTQCQVMTSTAILRAAVAKPGIAGLPSLQDSSNPVGKLKMMVSAEPDKLGELISVSSESANAQDAAAITNAVVESYIEYISQQYKSTAVDFLRIMQGRVDQYEAQLKTTNDAMLHLKRENPDLVSTADRSASPSSARQSSVSEALTTAQLRLLDLNTAKIQAQAVKDDPYRLKRVLDQFTVTTDAVPAVDPSLLSEYRQRRNEVDELTIRLGAQHDSVKAAQRQLARVEGEVADATRGSTANMIGMLEQAITATNARVTELQRESQAVRGTNIDLNVKQVEYEQLVQDAERIQRSLDQLDTRMKDINVTEDAGALSVTVLEIAQPGGMPIRPVRGKTLAMGLMAGLMLGVGLALLRDTLDHRLRTVDDITACVDAPLLGSVPHITSRSAVRGAAAGVSDRGRCVHTMPKSSVAEAFRTLRTAVYFGIPEHTAGKTILVTSPAPGDGKSTTASNLAIAFAQAGRRVLLIDADCRRPSQGKIHGVANAPGLADVLSGSTQMADAIKPTIVDQLSLLPAGEIPSNPAELLDSPAFRMVIADLANKYDQVIIDSPPIVPVTDARIIAAVADATILVLRAERSTRRLAMHARDALASVNARLIGVVVSDVPRGSQSYGYYGAGRYGYSNVQVDVGGATSNGHTNGEQKPSRERIAGELINEANSPRD